MEILLREQAQDPAARRALQAWHQMRSIVAGADAKLDLLEELFRRHASDRAIVFTASNEMAYQISQLFLIPAITHQTNARERKTILQRFESGQYKAVVTSKVLNEGVDVPAAAVAIILGGSGSTREQARRALRNHGALNDGSQNQQTAAPDRSLCGTGSKNFPPLRSADRKIGGQENKAIRILVLFSCPGFFLPTLFCGGVLCQFKWVRQPVV